MAKDRALLAGLTVEERTRFDESRRRCLLPDVSERGGW